MSVGPRLAVHRPEAGKDVTAPPAGLEPAACRLSRLLYPTELRRADGTRAVASISGRGDGSGAHWAEGMTAHDRMDDRSPVVRALATILGVVAAGVAVAVFAPSAPTARALLGLRAPATSPPLADRPSPRSGTSWWRWRSGRCCSRRSSIAAADRRPARHRRLSRIAVGGDVLRRVGRVLGRDDRALGIQPGRQAGP